MAQFVCLQGERSALKPAPEIFPWARQSAGPAPLRRAGSVRRTTNIDVHWPNGVVADAIMEGSARDIFTPEADSAPVLLAEGSYKIKASPARAILEIEASPVHPSASQLVGIRGGGDSRLALGRIMGNIAGSPLYQILDDFAGASLVSRWIWSSWVDDWQTKMREAVAANQVPMMRPMTNICTGFAEGASSLSADGFPAAGDRNPTPVGSLVNPDDPEGWHVLADQSGPRFRRARRIDVWRENDLIQVDVGFQDSGPSPEGTRVAVHEYQLSVTADPETMAVTSLVATPRILPFRECPGAALKAQKMVGHVLGDFRNDVVETLPGIEGCTHLNDVMRALADVPKLAEYLPQA